MAVVGTPGGARVGILLSGTGGRAQALCLSCLGWAGGGWCYEKTSFFPSLRCACVSCSLRLCYTRSSPFQCAALPSSLAACSAFMCAYSCGSGFLGVGGGGWNEGGRVCEGAASPAALFPSRARVPGTLSPLRLYPGRPLLGPAPVCPATRRSAGQDLGLGTRGATWRKSGHQGAQRRAAVGRAGATLHPLPQPSAARACGDALPALRARLRPFPLSLPGDHSPSARPERTRPQTAGPWCQTGAWPTRRPGGLCTRGRGRSAAARASAAPGWSWQTRPRRGRPP